MPLLTVAQAAAQRGLSIATVRRWCKLGWVVAVKPGHDYLIDEESVMSFTPPRPGVKAKKESE